MKLKYERFEGMGCFYVRGHVDAAQFKLLVVGLENLAKELEETLVVNLSLATLDAAVIPTLNQLKKKLSISAQKIYWVSHDKAIGDFPTIELFVSRLTGFKFRQIGERIKLEDQLYAIHDQTKIAEAREAELGGTSQNARKIILENRILKEQKRILEESIQWQQSRIELQKPVETADSDVPTRIAELKEELKKAAGHEVGL